MTATSSRYAYEGTETTETSITRDDGFVDLTGSQQSRKIVTTANAQWLRPFKAESYSVWNPTTGVDVDVTVYGIVNSGALPNNDDIWLELSYLGDGSSTLGSIVHTTRSNLLATNAAVAADGSEWDGVIETAAWDIATATAATLSGGNLVATSTGTSSADQGVHVASATGQTSGKYYFETTLTVAGSGNDRSIGIGTITSTYADMGDRAATGVMVLFSTGNIYADGVYTGTTLSARSTGNVIGIAADLDNRKIWFRVAPSGNWNNSGTANPATNVGGIVIPAGAMVPFNTFGGTGGAAGVVTTTNFGASAFTGAVPSGFTAGWPTTWSPFKLTTTLDSPQPGLAGLIEARVRVGKASAVYYIDPQVELTPAGGGTINGATAYKSERYTYEGTETTETSIVRTGGAVDPTGQAQSRKIVTTANAQWLRPFKAEPYAIWNDTVGADVTVTVCGTVNSGSLPNNDDIWLEVEYLGDASSTLGSIVHTTKSNLLASNAAVVSDGSSWGGGGSGAGWSPFKLTTTLDSPQPGQPGYIHARVKVGKASATYYIDPQIELS